jgi:hypothetical protein
MLAVNGEFANTVAGSSLVLGQRILEFLGLSVVSTRLNQFLASVKCPKAISNSDISRCGTRLSRTILRKKMVSLVCKGLFVARGTISKTGSAVPSQELTLFLAVMYIRRRKT